MAGNHPANKDGPSLIAPWMQGPGSRATTSCCKDHQVSNLQWIPSHDLQTSSRVLLANKTELPCAPTRTAAICRSRRFASLGPLWCYGKANEYAPRPVCSACSRKQIPRNNIVGVTVLHYRKTSCGSPQRSASPELSVSKASSWQIRWNMPPGTCRPPVDGFRQAACLKDYRASG